jgi:hypothetical protein
MGRPSKLTEKQWAEVGKRLRSGEKGRKLAEEFKVSEAAIRARFSAVNAEIKTVANQLLSAEAALKALPVSAQIAVIDLADELRAISSHLASAAKYGAASAHRLAGIAHAKVKEIDDAAAPLTSESLELLRGVAVLTKIANESSIIGMGLLSANRELIREANTGGHQSKEELLREIAAALPN